MSWVFGALAVTLGFVLLWGVVAPRSQWHALAAWSVADHHRNEPGGAAYGMRRLMSGLGALGLLAVVGLTSAAAFADQPSDPPPPSLVSQLWGRPDPDVVNRMVVGLAVPPAGLVEVPVLAYEDVSDDLPEYYDRLDYFTLLGKDDPPGYVGKLPDVGNGALDFADLIVQVRGPLLCIPRAVVVIETVDTIQVGVYYGAPDAPDGTPVDHAIACPLDSHVTGSVLIPLELLDAVGDRTVVTLTGDAIREVVLPRE